MANIARLNVALTANTSGFSAGMGMAARTLGVVQSAYAKATDQAAAYDRMQASVGQLKLAGAETLTSLQTVLAVARSELRKFGRNRDVQIAVEIGREYLDESWRKVQPYLQNLVARSKVRVAAQFVADKTTDIRTWIDQQRRSLTKPITVRVELARRAIAEQVDTARAKLDGLKQYRAVRIGLAAVNGVKAPVQAAMAALGPLTRLGGRGVAVALRATHFGVAVGVNKAKALLSGLLSHGRSVASGITGMFSSLAGGIGGIAAMVGGAAVASVGGLATYPVRPGTSKSRPSTPPRARRSRPKTRSIGHPRCRIHSKRAPSRISTTTARPRRRGTSRRTANGRASRSRTAPAMRLKTASNGKPTSW